MNGDRKSWDAFNQLRQELFHSKRFNDHLQQMGYDRHPDDTLMPETQVLTIYAYPNELNYPQIRNKSWFNLEAFDRNEAKQTVDLQQLLPASFVADTLEGRFSGKLVYISLGSMGSVELSLMKQLVEVLGSTPHKYIVSKGPRHCEYGLAANMWGDRFLPQTRIIPLVDAVITHGGNNTTTEVFAHGKVCQTMLGNI